MSLAGDLVRPLQTSTAMAHSSTNTCRKFLSCTCIVPLFIAFLLCHSEFEEEGQYAITTGNLSAFGTTGHEVVAGLFNKLEWTPEQVDDLQGIHINGTLTSLCRNTDGTVCCICMNKYTIQLLSWVYALCVHLSSYCLNMRPDIAKYANKIMHHHQFLIILWESESVCILPNPGITMRCVTQYWHWGEVDTKWSKHMIHAFSCWEHKNMVFLCNMCYLWRVMGQIHSI